MAKEKANSLGVISPKISNRIVIIITSITKERYWAFSEKTCFPKLIATTAAKEEAATFTIVLPKRIKTSNSLGLRINFNILRDFLSFFFSSFLISNLDKAKNAVSEPEKKADRIKKTKINM